MIGRVRIDQASAIFWGAALAGPDRHNTIVPYGLTFADGEASRRPLVRGYHGHEVPRDHPDHRPPQTAGLWDRWARELDVEQWAVAPGRLGVVVVDVDDPSLVGEMLDLYGETTVFVESPRGGFHLYYRAPSGLAVPSRTGVRGPGSYDIKAAGSTVHAPGSRHHACPGRYLARAPGLAEDGAVVRVERGKVVPLLAPRSLWPLLPEFRPAVFDEEWEAFHPTTSSDLLDEYELPDTPKLRDALRAYMRAAGPAVSGRGGHDHTFKLLRKIGDLGCPEDVALVLAREWNETCEPPWTDLEIRIKVRDAYHTRDLPIGWRAREFGLVDDAGDGDDDYEVALEHLRAGAIAE